MESKTIKKPCVRSRTPDNYKKQFLLKIILILFLFLLPCISSYAEEETDSIWTGWAEFESGSDGWYQTGGDDGRAYGRYQFDIGYDFVNFLKYCISTDSEGYKGFEKFIGLSRITKGSSGVTENKPLIDARAEMSTVWKEACNTQGENFFQLQTNFASSVYYYPVKSKLMQIYGINLDNYGPVLKGTVWSIAVRDGGNVSRNPATNNLRAVTETYRTGISEEEWLNAIYDVEAERHPSQRQRWDVGQRRTALESLGLPADEINNVMGKVGTVHSYDGSSYTDYTKEWIDKYSDTLSKEFISTGGWNSSNKEWVQTLRTAGDFYEMYGIQGGSVGAYLDFSAGVSGGSYIDGVSVDANTYEIPDNGSNNPVVYLGQSNSAGGGAWASVRFGGKNIAYSGCSVTSLSMVISYLKGGVNKQEWVFPNDVVAMIANKNGGNYNKFYSGNAGQSWGIFPAVAGYYGLRCSQISSSSIVNSLRSGKPVIMSCKPGEFTSTGHFIVITGVDSEGYCYVNDPAHPDKSYKKYSASFLASQGKGWWSFSD